MSARPVTLMPKTILCSLQEVDVIRSVDPFGETIPKSHNSDKSMAELGIKLPTDTMSPIQLTEAKHFLDRWKHTFSYGLTDPGCTNIVQHGIELSDSTPFKDASRRIPPGMIEEVRKHLKDMLDVGAIRESHSPYSSNVVLVRKKDGSLRFCIDFRRLNSRTVKDAYALPRIDETIDHLAGSKYFSKLDLRSGYWQVGMKESDKSNTAFSVGPSGFYECNRMAFGLTNAPATFQRLMERCMGDIHLKECLIYLDDVIIYSETLAEHFSRLENVFLRLEEAGLKLKGYKCEFFKTSVAYLGHIVGPEGVQTDPEKVRALKEWPVPTSVKELRSFLGFASYYRRFVPAFASIAKPLNDIFIGHPNNGGKRRKAAISLWEWGNSEQQSFEIKIQRLTSPPTLAYADYSKPFIINTDASGTGLGAVLYQEQDGAERVVAYASRGLRKNEINYPAHKLEYLALKWAVADKFHDYLYRNQFLVRTDNNPLTYVLSSAKLDATSHRWLAALSAYNFSIQYHSGKKNIDADALSRIPGQEVARFVFPDSLKALCAASSVSFQSVPVAECLSFSQQVFDSPADDIVGSIISDIDWKEEQTLDTNISRVIDIFKGGHKPTSR